MSDTDNFEARLEKYGCLLRVAILQLGSLSAAHNPDKEGNVWRDRMEAMGRGELGSKLFTLQRFEYDIEAECLAQLQQQSKPNLAANTGEQNS